MDLHVDFPVTVYFGLNLFNLFYFLSGRSSMRFLKEETRDQVQTSNDAEDDHDWEVAFVNDVKKFRNEHYRQSSYCSSKSNSKTDNLSRIQFSDVDEKYLEHEGNKESHHKD